MKNLKQPSNWHAIVPTIAAAFFVIQIIPVYENDIFLHTLLGGYLAHGGSAAGDPSWVFGPHLAEWHNTMAASELVFYWLQSTLGWGGITLWAAISGAGFVMVFWRTALEQIKQVTDKPTKRHYRLAGIASLVAMLMFQSFFQTRPQSVIFAVLPIVAWQLLKIATIGTLPKWWQAFLFTWMLTCVHPTTILFAPLMLGALAVYTYVYRKTAKPLATWLKALPVIAATAAATLLTPAGISVYTSAISIREAASNVTTEWLGVTSVVDPQVLVLLALAAIWLLAARRTSNPNTGQLLNRTAQAEALLIIGLTVGFGSVRRTAAIAAVIIAVIALNRWVDAINLKPAKNSKPEKPANLWLTAPIGIAGIAVLAFGLIVQIPKITIDPTRQPVEITKQLVTQNPSAQVYVDYDISSFVLYALRSGDPNFNPNGQTAKAAVSFDGRLDYFGPQVLQDFVDANEGLETATKMQPYLKATDAIVDQQSAVVTYLKSNNWNIKATEPGIRPLGEKVTWVWLQAPASE